MSSPHHTLDLVIDFVNTLDIEAGTDTLSTEQDLLAWLAETQLLATTSAPPSEADRLDAVRLREALRALMLANNGAGTPDEHAGRELERAARRGELGVHFAPDGSVSLAPDATGFRGALARLLVPVANGLADGSWSRAKACRAPDCSWAFYDRSRNRSGVWCEMAVCGNRTKVRAYRDRSPREPR
jgi:predicted RNA-binding Zn ribbon-like protein